MDLETLDHKLYIVMKGGPNVFNITYMEDVFSITPAWEMLWPNIEMFLRLPECKMVTQLETAKIRHQKLDRDTLIQFTCILEIGILGLLWCSGS